MHPPKSLYHYWPTRERLLREAAALGWQQFRTDQARAVGDVADPVERIRRPGRAYLDFAAERPALFRLLFLAPTIAADDATTTTTGPGKGFTDLVADVGAAIGAGRLSPGDPQAVALRLWCAAHGVAALMAVTELSRSPSRVLLGSNATVVQARDQPGSRVYGDVAARGSCGDGRHGLSYNPMVVDTQADRIFHALADATRREIVTLTLSGDHSVSELARRFPMSFAAVQKHVAVLESAGLVTKQRRGREQRVSGNIDALNQAHRLLDRLEAEWRRRIDRIDVILAEPELQEAETEGRQGASP